MKKVSQNRALQQRPGFTLIEAGAVIIVFIITIAILTPFVRIIRERSRIINCANRLRLLSLGIHMYAADNKGAFPPSLSALYPGYVKDEKTFNCPAAKTLGTPDRPDFEYITGLTEASPQSEVIVYDMNGNHRSWGRNVLRVSGAVETVSKGERKPR